MKIYLAGVENAPWVVEEWSGDWKPYILVSYFYCKDDMNSMFSKAGDVIVDSGAFTFMQKKKSLAWEEYIDGYADFIVKHDIDKYFELDIDSIVGYEKVKEFRRRLENKTGRPSIPVWHTGRGQKEFERMCQEYPYVALGGLVGTGSKEYAREYWKYFPWFIKTAHDNGAKIHALGFTSLPGLRLYHFDSVDSTTWNSSYVWGNTFRYYNGDIVKVPKPKGMKTAFYKDVATISFGEWVKMQRYADTHL